MSHAAIIRPREIEAVLRAMDAQRHARFQAVRKYPDDVAGGPMDVDAIAVRPDVTLHMVLDYLRRYRLELGRLPAHTDAVMVVDLEDRHLGRPALSDLASLPLERKVQEVMDRKTAAARRVEPDQDPGRALIQHGSMSEVSIPSGAVTLEGVLELPARPRGAVVFSHGSGSGRFSTRNRYVAGELRKSGMATLLLDLLTEAEDRDYDNRFDIPLLTERLGDAVRFVERHAGTRGLPMGLFGASTGAASALRVAAAMPHEIAAVVSRGGRPDLAGRAVLGSVKAPTLLIVGGEDRGVIELNEAARDALANCPREMVLVRGATHLFEEPGTLEQVARLAAAWFARHFAPAHA